MARKLSQKIDDLAHECHGRRQMTIQEIIEHMDMAMQTFIAWILYLPFILCFEIPGFWIVVSLMVIWQGIRTAQHKGIWIPKKLKKKHVKGDDVARLLSYTIPFLKKLEKIAHPRGTVYQHHPMLLSFNGCMMALGGCFLLFPIGTSIVPGLGAILLSLGMVEEDILWMFCAYGIFAIHAAHLITHFSDPLENPEPSD
jgi:hypothetical protein